MKTPQRYAALQRIAMHTELPADQPALPTQAERLEQMAQTLQNLSCLLVEPRMSNHYCQLTASVERLLSGLAHCMAELDPLLIEALSSHSVTD